MNLEFFMGVAAGMACCGCWMIGDLIAKKKFLTSSPRKMSITEHCNKASGDALTLSLLHKAYPDHQIVHEEDGSWTCSKPTPKASELNLKSSDIGVVRAMLQSNAAAYSRGILNKEQFERCEQVLTIALNKLERTK